MQYKNVGNPCEISRRLDALKKKNEIIRHFVKRGKLNCPIFPSGIKGVGKTL